MSHHAHKHLHSRSPKKGPREPFDFLVYFFVVATPLFELPQAIAIYTSQNAESVSALTWTFFLLSDIVWIYYAIRKRLLPLIAMYLLYLIVEATIVVGIFLYS